MSISFEARLRLGSFAYEAAFAAEHEVLVLFGHSGAGKSVTLQIAAGLLRPDAGEIAIDGGPVYSSARRVNVPPQGRSVGYVVQDLALFPHLTVAGNVAFGVPRSVDRQGRVTELLHLLGLDGFEERRPASLSGGQQQRVALARALARDASLLLLDEPFSALDDALRAGLRHELLRLRKDLGLTILFVTHDLREAHLLADRIAVFDAGHILQLDTREAVFRRPASRRVAELTGVANILPATVVVNEGPRLVVETAGLRLACAAPADGPFRVGERVDLAIRAERVNLRRATPTEAGPNSFSAHIDAEFAYGSTHTLRLSPLGAGPAIEVELAARPYEVLGVAARRDWTVELPPEDLHVMPGASV